MWGGEVGGRIKKHTQIKMDDEHVQSPLLSDGIHGVIVMMLLLPLSTAWGPLVGGPRIGYAVRSVSPIPTKYCRLSVPKQEPTPRGEAWATTNVEETLVIIPYPVHNGLIEVHCVPMQ